MIGFKVFLEEKKLKTVTELVYTGMLGMQELYEIPEFSEYIESLSETELAKDVKEIWNKFVKLVKSGKIKLKQSLDKFIVKK